MKTSDFVFKLIIAFSIYLLLPQSLLQAQQSNFQIAPSPIAYPYFEEGRHDGNLGVSFINISTQDMNMTGGAGDFKGRIAFSEFAAIDGNLGLNMLGGTMPGIPPLISLYPYIAEVAGEATLTYFSFRMAFNIEIQPVKTDVFSLIFFGGPNMNISQFTITTPFNLRLPPTYTTVAKGYTDTLTINTNLTGWQAGVQIDLPLGGDARLSPFFMYSSFSGTATLTDTTTVSGYGSTSMTVDVPGATATSFGMDIIFGEISIGTLLQQMAASDSTTQDTSIIMISISYHFSSEEDNTGLKEEEM
ncbi:MAG: hypothetical protein CVV49_18685 [Spirochaetae bacterium HGW-Spirochaetae-5]|nr:MAG: hypothetical protein CVV49_18685 [Spirochaetae bacterium HGW-Spirochaetae-5]